MAESESFLELVERVRRGDQQAAADLVRRYEPAIRREVRLTLTDPGLRRVIDSVDICQSVLGNFFARVALGQFDLEDPKQLMALLVTMARNRLMDWARQQHAQRRDQRRQVSLEAVGDKAGGGGHASPSRIVAGRELLDEIRRRLTDEERRIAELRGAGADWRQIAEEIGGTPEALRKRHARALDRVSKDLDL